MIINNQKPRKSLPIHPMDYKCSHRVILVSNSYSNILSIHWLPRSSEKTKVVL